MQRLPRQRFTLIELLVVVAIIAILASLLLPALASARARALATQCMSHQKQIGLALALYESDFGGFSPAATCYPEVSTYNWGSFIIDYRNPYATFPAAGTNYIAQTDRMLLNCPASVASRKAIGSPGSFSWVRTGVTYGATQIKGSSGHDYNNMVVSRASGVGTRSWQFYRLDRSDDPSAWLYIGDSSADEDVIGSQPEKLGLEGSAFFLFTDSNNVALYLAHRNRANVLMADMHAQPFGQGDAYTTSNHVGWNPPKIGALRFLTEYGQIIQLW